MEFYGLELMEVESANLMGSLLQITLQNMGLLVMLFSAFWRINLEESGLALQMEESVYLMESLSRTLPSNKA